MPPCFVCVADLSPSKKKPIGGHGGVGGSVIIEASRFVKDLTMNTYNYKGERYGHWAGCAGNRRGTTGQHPSCQGVVSLPRLLCTGARTLWAEG
jgi:GTPase involved in cell partitioning and DNA repair